MYEKIYPIPQTPYRKRKVERERDFSTLQLETGYDQNILIPTYSSYFIDKRNVRDFLLCNLSEVYKFFIITHRCVHDVTTLYVQYNPKKNRCDVSEKLSSFPLFIIFFTFVLFAYVASFQRSYFSNPFIFNIYMHIHIHTQVKTHIKSQKNGLFFVSVTSTKKWVQLWPVSQNIFGQNHSTVFSLLSPSNNTDTRNVYDTYTYVCMKRGAFVCDKNEGEYEKSVSLHSCK